MPHTAALTKEELPYVFKTKPFAHQLEAFERSREMELFALLMEMGTGKSKVVVDTAAYLYGKGRINSVLLVAPNGVHRKWLNEDFPLSWPDWCEMKGAVWQSGNAKALKQCDELFRTGAQMRVLCMNVEGFSHKSIVEYAKKFLLATDCLLVVDESHKIKNPDAARTKNLCALGRLAKYKRILTGTPIMNSPLDYYAQFQFLDPHIFGQSYFAFKAEYAVIADASDPMVTAIMRKQGLKRAPMLVKRDSNGREMYRNLDKLKSIVTPYSVRYTKEECLDLPEKIYEKRYFQLEPKQWKMYEQLRTTMMTSLGDERVTVLHKMTLLMRLQQLASGYFPGDESGLQRLYANPTDNPRIRALMEALEDIDGKVIIWCRFVDEIRDVAAALGDSAVMYYGAVKTADRESAIERFTNGDARFLIGNAATGGTGLNLTVATTVVYYSNTFSYGDRKQSEDRAHRIGQRSNVVYIDLEAENTVDAKIIRALRNKEDVATYMTNFNDI